jgi:alpha-D-ribose 1-methylphosphonate 5-triphosphate synthase subunit PhnH
VLAETAEISDWLKFHTGAPLTGEPGTAAFAFIADPAKMPGFDVFCGGSVEYPDRSTTLVLQVEQVQVEQPAEHGGFRLSGPGIKGSRLLSASPLPADFPDRMAANRALFPRGIDLVLTCGRMLAGLPRSVHLAKERP